jgi:hypothetical protein
MVASIGTSANIYSGLRELSNVTNTYGGYLQSAGVAYNLILPWQADKLQWWNYTKWATNTQNLNGVWFRDFPAGDALIIDRGTTTLTSTLEATNGVTVANTAGGFADEHVTITGISTAGPAVVTASGHGLADDDRVVITKVIGTMAAEVNNKTFVVDVLSSSTFALYDTAGNAITTVGSYSSSGQINKTGPSLGVVNAPVSYILTLGTAVMGNDNDVIYFEATKMNAYFNLGDIT